MSPTSFGFKMFDSTLPGVPGRLLRELTEEIGAIARVEAQRDNIRLEFFRDGARVGFFRASTVSTDGYTWENLVPEECKTSWRELGEPDFWVVRSAEWFDPLLRSKGLGLLAYNVLISYIESVGGGVVGPDSCAGESTSQNAERVWGRIRSQRKTRGPLVLVGGMRTMTSPTSSGSDILASRVARRYLLGKPFNGSLKLLEFRSGF